MGDKTVQDMVIGSGVAFAIVVAAISSGAFQPTGELYYCEADNLVFQCSSLSSSLKTCYLSSGVGKRCYDGSSYLEWKTISGLLTEPNINPKQKDKNLFFVM